MFTNEREVNAMLDMVRQETERIDSRFLEPACGDGNFLSEVLRRKLDVVDSRYRRSIPEWEKYAFIAVGSIYGVELLRDNTMACRNIQRFGRIDRIGSKNSVIQLVNFWPDITLDEYINLKSRVETRMKIVDMTATGDDNILSDEEKHDLEYRKAQLKRLQEEVVDIEEMSTGISIMDLGLNEFRMDLLEYINHL